MSWPDVIRDGLDEDRFVLQAQPIMNLETGDTSQFELLLRLRDPLGELISPAAFLPAAERYDLIGAIDRWVVTRSIAMLAEENRRGRRLTFEINISGRSAGDPELLALIEHELRTNEVDPAQVIFEITETTAVANIPRAQEFAHRLAALGCRFALDDFGAAFASFYYLKHLPFDYLKIDGEFVRGCVADRTDQLVIRAVVDIARGLGKSTVAEMVVDEETLELVRRPRRRLRPGLPHRPPGPARPLAGRAQAGRPARRPGGLAEYPAAVIFIALAIAASLAAGVEAERRAGARAGVWARRILTFLLYVVMPVVAFFNMARLEVRADVGVGIVLGWIALALTALAGWLIGAPPAAPAARLGRRAGHRRPAGQHGPARASPWSPRCSASTTCPRAWSTTRSCSSPCSSSARSPSPRPPGPRRARPSATGCARSSSATRRCRVLLGAVAPDALAPDVLVDAARLLVLTVPVLGFFAIGVTLAEEAEDGALVFPPPLTAGIGASIVLRGWWRPGCCSCSRRRSSTSPPRSCSMAAMPAGLHIVVLAHVYGLDIPFAAG